MKTLSVSLTALAASLAASAAFAGDKVVFGTNWLAQGGHGGFYQALADGTYEKYGLEVEIRQGGPQVNNRPMLIAGKLDFLMAGNLLLSFDNVRNGIPTTVVAAIFQKDPQALIAHEGAYDSWEDLTTAPEILLSKDGQFSYWKWMVQDFGFRDEQVRPYGYNLAQFLSDEKMVQQAYATAEPLYAAAEGADVATYLMADYGWNTYATTIETRQQMIDENPDVVQRFVDASIEGWYTFLYGDHTAGYEAIIAANPELTVEKLDAEMAQVRELGIIDSGDALELGIGAMTDARIAAFYETAVNSGILEEGGLDLSKVADTSFVNKRHGIEIKTAAEAN
ncbi:nitrate ABC transporter substrate-binding protein (plasmid) [Alloyangia pacifica]|uniref:Nitrate ABC transporter substrate-binding protein n=1 Tax=Alloyangia pacifica TaxID=311180 RepID=A0A2U8HKL8_9RHOB|nr:MULTISPECIES: ABC transporter substrate-binding protein [Roseobacteraceae]AWI86110.1 nitrate ABC transporter substrate-binding protein [Alloyangia pacifica]NDV53560.1 ABC transporter substrate-binding protein [Salipiger sp. PrR003]NDW35039.1 ABC transporter substrate-binding protein [Salipiger sp. PrR007]